MSTVVSIVGRQARFEVAVNEPPPSVIVCDMDWSSTWHRHEAVVQKTYTIPQVRDLTIFSFELPTVRLLAAKRMGGRWAFGGCNIDVLYAMVFYSLDFLSRLDGEAQIVGLDIFATGNVCDALYLFTIIDALGKFADSHASNLERVLLLPQQFQPTSGAKERMVTDRLSNFHRGTHVPHQTIENIDLLPSRLTIFPGEMSYRRHGPRRRWSG